MAQYAWQFIQGTGPHSTPLPVLQELVTPVGHPTLMVFPDARSQLLSSEQKFHGVLLLKRSISSRRLPAVSAAGTTSLAGTAIMAWAGTDMLCQCRGCNTSAARRARLFKVLLNLTIEAALRRSCWALVAVAPPHHLPATSLPTRRNLEKLGHTYIH